MTSQIPFPTVFDSSMLATYKSCPQKFFKEYFLHLKAKELSVHLKAGGAFATGVEVARREFFENGLDASTAIGKGLLALLKSYGDFVPPSDSAKSPERMAGAFEFYFANYPLEKGLNEPIVLPGGKRAIEFSFAHPLPVTNPETGDPILYCGRMDAILEFADQPFITDEKTTSQLGATWSRQWDLRSQFTGYAWGCRESGIKVAGAIIRGVSILKTKYETQQAITYRPEWQIDRWYEQTVLLIADIKARWSELRGEAKTYQAFPYSLDHACTDFGGCAFRQVCSTQDEGSWLETYFERRQWNPLTRVEEKL